MPAEMWKLCPKSYFKTSSTPEMFRNMRPDLWAHYYRGSESRTMIPIFHALHRRSTTFPNSFAELRVENRDRTAADLLSQDDSLVGSWRIKVQLLSRRGLFGILFV